MTDIDYKGKRINQPKMIDVTYKNWFLITEEILCTAINEGLFRKKEEIETIGKLIKWLKLKQIPSVT